MTCDSCEGFGNKKGVDCAPCGGTGVVPAAEAKPHPEVPDPITVAVAAEREACARFVETFACERVVPRMSRAEAERLADAIRARPPGR